MTQTVRADLETGCFWHSPTIKSVADTAEQNYSQIPSNMVTVKALPQLKFVQDCALYMQGWWLAAGYKVPLGEVSLVDVRGDVSRCRVVPLNGELPSIEESFALMAMARLNGKTSFSDQKKLEDIIKAGGSDREALKAKLAKVSDAMCFLVSIGR